MAQKMHWPFGDSMGQPHDAQSIKRTWEIARERTHHVSASTNKHLRNDRLLVGGRAHTKKPGLS